LTGSAFATPAIKQAAVKHVAAIVVLLMRVLLLFLTSTDSKSVLGYQDTRDA
jgi:hypothetical protein